MSSEHCGEEASVFVHLTHGREVYLNTAFNNFQWKFTPDLGTIVIIISLLKSNLATRIDEFI